MKRLLLALLFSTSALGQTYDPTLLPPQLLGSPQTMTPLNGGDDSTRLVQLGFPFEYYGQTFTSAWVSTNGFVSFQSPAHLCCNGYPMDQAQRNTIYAYWTDLISTGNPYYRTDSSSALFGWYNTYEYGTQNKNTFEINLSADGSIQFNYGALGNTYHLVSAGITGPTATDNIQLFYGQNVQNMQNQSGLLAVSLPPEPEPVVPILSSINPAPVVAPDPTEEVQAAQVDIAQEPAAEEPTTEEPTVVEEVASEIVQEVATEEPTTADEPAKDETVEAERLSPEQVLALAATDTQSEPTPQVETQQLEQLLQTETAQSDQVQVELTVPVEMSVENVEATPSNNQFEYVSTEQVVTDQVQTETTQSSNTQDTQNFNQLLEIVSLERPDTIAEKTQVEEQIESPRVATITLASAEEAVEQDLRSGFKVETPEPEVVQVEISQPQVQENMFSPVSQTTTMELLSSSIRETNTTPDMGNIVGNSNDSMGELAVAPAGYSAYNQTRIPDAPFYAARDIYKKRKIPDAYWELYRIMRSQDEAWNDMVEDQYER